MGVSMQAAGYPSPCSHLSAAPLQPPPSVAIFAICLSPYGVSGSAMRSNTA